MAIDIVKLKKTINEIRKDLGEGFVDTDIWDISDTKSLLFNYRSDMYTYGMTPLSSLSSKAKQTASYQGQPKAISLFREVTRKLDQTLNSVDYPGLGNYYLINLANNHLALVLTTGSYQQFLLVDLSKTTMGILMSIVLPKMLKGLK
jgi:hypothetical protein